MSDWPPEVPAATVLHPGDRVLLEVDIPIPDEAIDTLMAAFPGVTFAVIGPGVHVAAVLPTAALIKKTQPQGGAPKLDRATKVGQPRADPRAHMFPGEYDPEHHQEPIHPMHRDNPGDPQ